MRWFASIIVHNICVCPVFLSELRNICIHLYCTITGIQCSYPADWAPHLSHKDTFYETASCVLCVNNPYYTSWQFSFIVLSLQAPIGSGGEEGNETAASGISR